MKLKLAILLYLILAFYIWTATYGKDSFYLENNHGGYYNLLTDAFLIGKLHLLEEPRQELLDSSNPYDSSFNGPYRLHDASLYKGKYYLYFGATPALVVYIPYRIFTKLGIPDNLVVLLFCFGTLFWSTLFLMYLHKNYFSSVPQWMLLLVVSSVAFGNVSPYLLRRPFMYEVAISCGIFFLTGAIYLLCSSCLHSHKSNFNLFKICLGSTFLGLAAGGRPQISLTGFVIVVLLLIYTIRDTQYTIQLKKATILCLAIPFISCLISIFLYNYLRFDNPFEFGIKYVLMDHHYLGYKNWDLKFFPAQLFLFLFREPEFNSMFPFVHLSRVLPPTLQPSVLFWLERNTGLLYATPFVLILFLSPFIYWLNSIFNCKVLCSKNKIIQNSILITLAIPLVLNIILLLLRSFSLDTPIEILEKLQQSVPVYIYAGLILLSQIIVWLIKVTKNCGTQCQFNIKFPYVEFIILLFCGIIHLLVVLFGSLSTFRYVADFSIFFILLAGIVWFFFDLLLVNNKPAKIFLRSIGTVLALGTIWCGFALSIFGCYEGLKVGNPEQFYKLEALFSPVSIFISSLLN